MVREQVETLANGKGNSFYQTAEGSNSSNEDMQECS